MNNHAALIESFSHFGPLIQSQRLASMHYRSIGPIDERLLGDFVRVVYREFKNNPFADAQLSEFLRVVSISGIGISRWLRQIVDLYSWLAARQETARFSDAVQYVHCSLDISNGEPITLILEQYGFERAVPSTSMKAALPVTLLR